MRTYTIHTCAVTQCYICQNLGHITLTMNSGAAFPIILFFRIYDIGLFLRAKICSC